MKIPFRQGVISSYAAGLTPLFLAQSATPNFIDFVVSPEPTVVAFAHAQSDYLQVFDVDVQAAWGPVTPGVNAFLYWEIDLLTAEVLYKFTRYALLITADEPTSPAFDQHWFDLSTTTMKYWNGTKWLPKVAVFAGVCPGGSTSNVTPSGYGTQVDLNVPSDPGFIYLASLLKPIYTNGATFEFLTSTKSIRIKTTAGTSGVLATPPNAFIPIRASEGISKFSLVYFSGSDTIGLASSNPALLIPRTPIGIVQEDLAANQMGSVTQSGEVQFDQWDWTGSIGKPVYCDAVGQITTHRPNGLLAYRIGFIKNKNTILFQVDAETLSFVQQASPNDIIIDGVTPLFSTFTTDLIGERVWSIEISDATTTQRGAMTAAFVNQLNAATAASTTNTSSIALLNTEVAQNTTDISLLSAQSAANTASITLLSSEVATLQAEAENAMQLVVPAVVGNFPALTATGQLVDSGLGFFDFAPAHHMHIIADVTGLQAALDSKVDATTFQIALDGKAATVHFNKISEIWTDVTRVAGMPDVGVAPSLIDVLGTYATQAYVDSSLSGKLGINDSIPISQVINLQAELDAKANSQDGVVLDVNTKPGPHVVLTTDDIGEGSLNKYLSNANFQILFNAAISAASINELVDVQTEYVDEHNNHIVPLDGQVLTWSAPIQQWIGATTSVNVTSVNTLVGDVVLTTTQIPEEAGANPPNQYFTIARFVEQFKLQPLRFIADVDPNLSPLPFDVLSWDGAKWTNLVLPAAPVRMVCGYTSDDFVGGNIALTTDDIPEAGNQYWTAKRFDDDFKAHYLTQLFDVQASPLPGQYLAWNQAVDSGGHPTGQGHWVAAAAPGAPVTSVNGRIGDVVLTASDFGVSSFYDTAQFTIDLNNQFPTKIANTTLTSLMDVHGAADGQFLQWNATSSTWAGGTPPTAAVTSVAGLLGDVILHTTNIVEPSNPDVDSLIFFSTTRFTNLFQQSNLSQLHDVTITSPQFNDALVYNGTTWINEPIPSAPVLTVQGLTGNVSLTTDNIGEGSNNLYYTATRFNLAFAATLQTTLLKSLHDVNGYTLANAGQFLKAFNNGDGTIHWGPADPPGAPVSSVAGRTGAITLTTDDVAEGSNQYFTSARVAAAIAAISIDGFNDVTITSPVTGQVLKWNGAQWVNDVVAVSSSAVISGLGYTPANRAGDAFTGAISSTSTVQGTRLISTVATGTAPLTVASTTLVTNLNAQQLNSQPSTYYSDDFMTFALSDETTTPTVGTAKITFRAPFPMTLTQIPRMSLSTAGSNLSSVDIKLAGTTILGANKLSIDASEKTSTTAATPTTLAITSIADDGEITVDITSVGIGALGFKVTLFYRKT